MSEQQPAAFTSADIQAVGEKLEEFSEGIPASQRAVLAWLLQRIGMESSDDSNVQGYAIVLQRRAEAPAGADAPAPTFQFECTWALEPQTG